MGFGDYLASLNMDPELASRLEATYGPPAPSGAYVKAPPPDAYGPPADAPADPYGPPSASELQTYGAMTGASPAEVSSNAAAAARFNAPAAAPPQAATNPVAADPAWTPEAEQGRIGTEQRRKALAGADPQGPAGSDGFPTYKDPSSSGYGQAPPTGPMRVVPGGWQHATRGESVQRGLDPSKLTEGQYHRSAAIGQGMLAGDKQLEAAQLQGEADATYAAAHAAASQRAAEEMQRLENEKHAYISREQDKLATLSEAASKQIDPEAAKGSGGAQLMAAIGIALGQFGASLTGGPNTALQIVQANIDRNMRAQELNIANANKAHDREQSLYKQNLEAFGDRERATLATKMQLLDQAKAMADQQYAKSKGSMNEAQYHQFMQGLNDKQAEYADQFGIRTSDQVTQQLHDQYRPAQVVGGPGGAKGKEKLFVPGLKGYARDEETARKLNAHAAMRAQINEDLHEMHGLLNEAKGLSSATDYGRMQEIRERIDGLKNGVLQNTTVLAGQGAMSNGDKGVAEIRSQIQAVDPQLRTEAQISRMQKGLVSVAKSHQRDARLEGEMHGIQVGGEQYVQGPSGPEARANLAGRNKMVSKETESFDDLVEKPKGKPAK